MEYQYQHVPMEIPMSEQMTKAQFVVAITTQLINFLEDELPSGWEPISHAYTTFGDSFFVSILVRKAK